MSAITHFIKKGVRQAEVDEYLAKELSRAGYGGVDISKTPLGERITIHAARPGIVIGRRGKNIRMITDELVNRYGFENPQIEVKEVDNPELNAKVMAYSLVSTIERGVHRRRAAYSVMRRVLNAGAKGCEIIIAGKLTSKRSRHEAYRMGLVAKSGEMGSEYVISATAIAVMKLGTIGVTVNIMRGDIILPDEISLLNVKLDEEVTVETTEKPLEEEEEAKKAEKPKKELEAEKEKAPKEEKPKKEVKEEKEITKKKTDLDLEVEELSELIEKTPGEEVKPKKAPVKKEEAPVTKPEAKKPSPTTKDVKPAKKEEKETEKPKDKKETKPAKDDKKDTKVTKDDKKDTKATKDDKKDTKAAKDDKKEVKAVTKKEQPDAKAKKPTTTKSADKSEKEPSKKKEEKPKKEEEKPSKAKDTKADSKEKDPKKEEAKDSKSKSKSDDKKK